MQMLNAPHDEVQSGPYPPTPVCASFAPTVTPQLAPARPLQSVRSLEGRLTGTTCDSDFVEILQSPADIYE
jgi:hypothetical protein